MSFSNDLLKFEKAVVAGSESVVQKVYIRASNHIIDKTPVDTGLARSNWFAGLNKFVQTTTPNNRRKGKSKRIARDVAAKFKLGGFLTLTNTLPYIVLLEDGHSKQAPVGMVKVVYALLDRWIQTEVKKLK